MELIIEFTKATYLSSFTKGAAAHRMYCHVCVVFGRSPGGTGDIIVVVLMVSGPTLDLSLPTSGDRPHVESMVERRVSSSGYAMTTMNAC